ncbi:MAG: hypothetical protein HQK79_17145 [Desulfobacterales bacterium]|nr:hypothetical protein [Desulfobacterales bacterium]MBF0395334.1 hypothetical protein [Desulfobacterales bacterium]
MKEEIVKLLNLQTVERDIEKIKKMLNDVPLKVDSLDSKLNQAKQSIEDETALLNELKKKYRSYDAELKTIQSGIDKSQERLSSVKTNKEYQASLKEIDEAKSKKSKFEDEVISCLYDIEEAEKKVAIKNKELKNIEFEIHLEKGKMEKEVLEGKDNLGHLNIEYDKLSKLVDPKLLKRYATIKTQVRWPFIASVKESACMGCNMNIPPQLYNELQRWDSLKLCPHCQRIIYCQEN